MIRISNRTLTSEQRRFLQFAVVGTLGTAVDFAILTSLKLAGWPTLMANSLSFTAGLLNNFTLNRLWTFSDRRGRNWRMQLVQFSAVSVVGLGLSNVILLSLEPRFASFFPDASWAFLPAKVIATGAVLFWNYFANRQWTFGDVSYLRK